MELQNQLKKIAQSLRSYAILSFLIFLLPFLQTCSDKVLKSQQKGVFNEEKLREDKKENTFNAYEFTVDSFRNFEIKYLKDAVFYSYAIYSIIVLLSILILIQSFRDKFKVILWLSTINIFLLLVSLMLMFFATMIETFDQIKIGWYSFLLNSIIMIYLSFQKVYRSTI